MNIAFLHPTLIAGGAERVMSILTRNWSQAGHNVTILYIEQNDKSQIIYDYDRKGKIKLIPLNALPVGRISYRLALRKIFRELNPEVIISFMNGTNILAASILKSFSKHCLIISERGNPIYANIGIIEKIKQKIFYRFADKVVFQTERAMTFGIKYYRLKQKQSCIIHNPARKPEYLNTAPKLPARTIVAMGRLHPHKGFDLLLQAFARIKDRHLDWQLIIIGEGEKREELEIMRAKLGMNGRVFFPGLEKDVFGIYKQAEIFVLSSRCEGMPNVLMEAMSAGCPCVAFDCDYGAAELIDNDQNGLLVPNGNVPALGEAIERLINDTELRCQLGSGAVQKMQEFDETKIVSQWNKLLEEVIKGG